MASKLRFACDIGGTFTDCLMLDSASNQAWVAKLPTTPSQPADAVMAGIKQLVAEVGVTESQIDDVIHSSTLANNLILERAGARTALLTTRGFRDVIEMRHQERYHMYDVWLDLPEPLVPRRLRRELDERVDASGAVHRPLDSSQVREVVGELVAAGVDSIAVCLLHSYEAPAHELEAARAIAVAAPQISVSLSSDVLPEIREYERTSTTVVDAYIRPTMHAYLDRLAARFEEVGAKRVRVMLSGGGIASIDTARRHPVRLIESGPSAGVLGAQYYAALVGIEDCLSFDMGGTTAKVGVIRGGRVQKTRTYEIDRVHRLVRGSGIPVQLPAIELLEVGAGGGSIAHVDALGLLEVGPQSAGAEPGPACYGNGGEDCTVTDADLVLGYLDPTGFLGGRIVLDVAAAERAAEQRLASPLGISSLAAAQGVYDLVNEKMAAAIRRHCLEQGVDASELSLVAFGGAGPLHACALARRLGVRQVVIPPLAGVMSALGLLAAPVSFDQVRTVKEDLNQLDEARLKEMVSSMTAEIARELALDPAEIVVYEVSGDMRYRGQGFDINVPLLEGNGRLVGDRRKAFDANYALLYGHAFAELDVEVVNLRVSAGEQRPPVGAVTRTAAPARSASGRVRRAQFSTLPEPVEVPVHDLSSLAPGTQVFGPAIVQEMESTILLEPGCSAIADRFGGLLVTLH
jgi:N-methylhydantoinase A